MFTQLEALATYKNRSITVSFGATFLIRKIYLSNLLRLPVQLNSKHNSLYISEKKSFLMADFEQPLRENMKIQNLLLLRMEAGI